MLKKISNLKGAKKLEAASQKKINGGYIDPDLCGCSGPMFSPCTCYGQPGWCLGQFCAY